jgi:glucose/arabinose dehydrogenase
MSKTLKPAAVLVAALSALSVSCLETAFAQSPEPVPAFPGQTDAPPPARPSPPLKVETVATGLRGAWSLAFLPDGRFLVTQGGLGPMRIVGRDGKLGEPIEGLPELKSVGAEGLHDVVLDPDFAVNRTLYFAYFAPPKGGKGGSFPLADLYENVWSVPLAERRAMKIGIERVARAKLSADERRLEGVDVIAEGAERRIALARDGTLYIVGSDRFWRYESKLDGMEHDFTAEPDIRRNFSGRVLRVNKDGSVPKDNPWLSRATVDALTFAHGLKDPEGAAIHPVTGELWVVDHGPQGGDEVNVIRGGRDYGWPDVSYGRQYDARQADGRKNVPVGNGKTSMPGVEEPVYYWVPSIAPSGMAFYTGELFPAWKGNLFVGAMAGQALIRLVLDGERVVAEERLLTDLKKRIREVRQGPDGALYVFAADTLLRITPR